MIRCWGGQINRIPHGIARSLSGLRQQLASRGDGRSLADVSSIRAALLVTCTRIPDQF